MYLSVPINFIIFPYMCLRVSIYSFIFIGIFCLFFLCIYVKAYFVFSAIFYICCKCIRCFLDYGTIISCHLRFPAQAVAVSMLWSSFGFGFIPVKRISLKSASLQKLVPRPVIRHLNTICESFRPQHWSSRNLAQREFVAWLRSSHLSSPE